MVDSQPPPQCDLWTPKHDRAADRAMEQLQRRALAEAQHKPASSEPGSQVAEPQPPQQQQQQQAALPSFPLPRFGECAAAAWSGAWDEGLLVPEAVWLFTQKSLRPLSLRVAAGFAGDDARAAALVHGDAHVTATLAAEVLVVAGMMPTVCAQLGAVHAAVNAALRSLPADRASSPAWRVLCAPPFDGTDAMLRGVLESASSLVGAVARSSSLRIRRGGLSPAEHVWLEEMYGSLSCTLELLGHVSRVLSAFRSAPLDGFLTVSANMLELMIVLVTSLGSASTQREQWMQAMIKARGAGCSAAAPDRAKLLVCYGDASDELNGAGAAQGGAGAAEMAQ